MLPKAILVENVRGLLRPALADFVEYICLQLEYPFVLPESPSNAVDWHRHLATLRSVSKGDNRAKLRQYHVKPALLNAANFGVGQRRERVFFVALRSDLHADWVPPSPTHSLAALRLAQQFTGAYWDAHGISRRLRKSALLEGRLRREAGALQPWVTVRDALRELPEPTPGKEFDRWRNHIGQAGARSYPGHTGSPLDLPAKTLKAGVHGVPGGENMLRRPNGSVRYFTVREAARLQSFPDSYEFEGAWGEAMRQIGNAVPVRLAEVVAGTIRRALEGAAERPRHSAGLSPSYEQAELHETLSYSR
jgi:DNA (cytosine-5)-methyltransferase 1